MVVAAVVVVAAAAAAAAHNQDKNKDDDPPVTVIHCTFSFASDLRRPRGRLILQSMPDRAKGLLGNGQLTNKAYPDLQ